MKITEEIVQRCHDLKYSDMPVDVIDRTQYLLLDYIGVAARGALSVSSLPVQRVVSNLDKTGDGAVVIGTDIRVNSPYAALANGIASHSLELDDVVNEASLHPAVAIMPAALASAHISGCTGEEFITAVVAGYEVMIKLGIALDPAAHYARGFHPTATCGTMGSAVTAAKILNLDQKSMQNALGIAGSQAAGSMEFLADGTYTKRFHPGWAAHSGIIAALLARDDFSGPGTIIEGRFGFLHSYSPNSDPSKIMHNWGTPYEVLKTSIKPHACCRYKQGPIDGILQIMRDKELAADDIESVNLAVLKAGFALVAEPEDIKYNPASIVDAQFSMPFGAAVAILHGKASLDQYTEENLNSPLVKAVMRKVKCITDPDIEKDFPRKWKAVVEIKTTVGKAYTAKVDYPKGDPENPFTWEELIEKFRDLISKVFSEGRQDQIIKTIQTLDQTRDVTELSNLLATN